MEENQENLSQPLSVIPEQNQFAAPLSKRLWFNPYVLGLVGLFFVLLGVFLFFRLAYHNMHALPSSTHSTQVQQPLLPTSPQSQVVAPTVEVTVTSLPQECKLWSSAGIIESTSNKDFLVVNVAGQNMNIPYIVNGKKSSIDESIHQFDSVKLTQSTDCLWYVEKIGI